MLDELESALRPPAVDMAPYPPKSITLASGEIMVVREARMEEIPFLMKVIYPLLWVGNDFYDIVAARLFAELLSLKRYRVRNEYCLVGVVDGVLAGIVNGRMFDQDHGISYHTLTLKRGLRVGAHLFAAKMEHHIEYLGEKEVWIVAESPIGFRRWMIEYPLDKKYSVQHELGGAPSWVLTEETYYKAKPRLVVGDRPIDQKLYQSSLNLKEPDLSAFMVHLEGTLEAEL